MDEPLCGTYLTGTTISKLLSDCPLTQKNGHQLQNVQATLITQDDQGCTSKILRILLNWSPSGTPDSPHLPKSLIIKVMGGHGLNEFFASMGEERAKALTNQLKVVHDSECAFYELEGLTNLIPIPLCYGLVRNTEAKPGLIMFQDLSEIGVPMTWKYCGRGLNLVQLNQILDALTTLHAWSLNSFSNWRRNVLECDQLLYMVPYMESVLSMFPQQKLEHPEIFRGVEEYMIKEILNMETFVRIFSKNPQKLLNLPTVLVHGDVHFGNLLFEKCDDKPFGNRLISILDWQCVQQGCGIKDLMIIFSLSLSTEVIREERENILKQYVELFNSKVQNENYKITFENAKQVFDEMLAFTAVMTGNILLWDSFTKQMNIDDDDELKATKERLVDYYNENFKHARKIFGI